MKTPLVVSLVAPKLEKLQAIDQRCFNDPWSVARWREFISEEQRYLPLMIEAEGESRGFLIFSLVCDEAELLRIGIVPEFRSRGIANTALSIAEKRLVDSGVKRLMLEVKNSNIKAQRLYLSVGFCIDGYRKGYYPAEGMLPAEDAMLMSKNLTLLEHR